MAFGSRQGPRYRRGGYRRESRRLFSESLHRRTRSADVAKDDGYKLRLTLFKRETFLANDAEEEVGPLRRDIFEYGRFSHTWHEPLHRHEDGNHRLHASFSKRCCKRRYHSELGVTWPYEYTV